MKKFGSSVNWIVPITNFIPTLVTIPIFLKGEYIIGSILLTVSVILGIIMIFGIEYKLDGKYLKIELFFLNYKNIPIESIKAIKRFNTMWLNSTEKANNNFKGIYIKYKTYDDIAISPKNEKEFIDELLKINPNIEVDLN
ncbi:MAG: PH domain-containing protein [Bacteroidota bacterium]|nr:PH domain-containing protein [Bacteroidota bacterium]